jgi:hypothetical protein
MIICVSENDGSAFLETFGKLLKGIDGVSGKILKKRMELYRKQQEITRNHYCIMQKIATMCRTGFLDFSGVIFSGEPFSDVETLSVWLL